MVQQVGVAGRVAPRCWTLPPDRNALLLAAVSDSRHSIAARCNHAATPISMQVRRRTTDGRASDMSLAVRGTPLGAVGPDGGPAGRTTIEILLSPTP